MALQVHRKTPVQKACLLAVSDRILGDVQADHLDVFNLVELGKEVSVLLDDLIGGGAALLQLSPTVVEILNR